MRLVGKVALITGGGSGIGLATARRFVAEGARVAITGRTVARLQRAQAELGESARAIVADMADPAAVEQTVSEVLAQWGRIDVLVANHSILNRPAQLHEIDPDEWQRVLTNNLTGYFLVCRAVLPVMMSQGGGAIVLVTSETVQSIQPYLGAYTASKCGAVGLMKTIAAEYGSAGIRCNIVQVGGTPGTEMATPLRAIGANLALLQKARQKPTALGRLGVPEDSANAILYLASDEAAWVTGATLNVDGGYTLT